MSGQEEKTHNPQSLGDELLPRAKVPVTGEPRPHLHPGPGDSLPVHLPSPVQRRSQARTLPRAGAAKISRGCGYMEGLRASRVFMGGPTMNRLTDVPFQGRMKAVWSGGGHPES